LGREQNTVGRGGFFTKGKPRRGLPIREKQNERSVTVLLREHRGRGKYHLGTWKVKSLFGGRKEIAQWGGVLLKKMG